MKEKEDNSFNLQIPEGGIYYINPDFFGFRNRLVPHACLPDNIYFEKYRYLEIPQ
jgi:hypothetical protein